jgi:hypothetical protein
MATQWLDAFLMILGALLIGSGALWALTSEAPGIIPLPTTMRRKAWITAWLSAGKPRGISLRLMVSGLVLGSSRPRTKSGTMKSRRGKEWIIPGRSLLIGRSPGGRRWRTGLRAGTLIAMIGLLAPVTASGQTPVDAAPTTYEIFDNVQGKTVVSDRPQSYDKNSNSYNKGLTAFPQNQVSFVQLSGTGFLDSAVVKPGKGDTYVIENSTAGANDSFGGLLVNGIKWKSIDVVMNQCFAGGFAYNMQGSLMGNGGPKPANGPTVGYTFSSGSSFNEVSYGTVRPTQNTGVDKLTAVGDFTQGWAISAATNGSMLTNYQRGINYDPFVVKSATSGNSSDVGVPNLVKPTPLGGGKYDVTKLGFESPVYASSDALKGGAADPNGDNNIRTLKGAASNTWAVLMAFTPGNGADFKIDIQREYAALLASGVKADHIAVLFGNDGQGTQGPPKAMDPKNNTPNLNTVVPINGSTSLDTIRGLLSGNKATWTSLQLPDGKHLVAPGDKAQLFVYTTGHGNAAMSNGAEVKAANLRLGPGEYTNKLEIHGATNFAGTEKVQIAMARAMPNLPSDTISVDGHNLAAATPVSVGGGAFNLSGLVGMPAGPELSYYDVNVPASDFSGPEGEQNFDFSVTSASDADILNFDRNIRAFTMIDDTSLADIASGAVDTFTVVASVPEPSTWLLIAVGASGVLATHALARRKGVVGAAISAGG